MVQNQEFTKAVFVSQNGSPSEVLRVHEVDLGKLPETQVSIDMLVSSINHCDLLTINYNAPVPLHNRKYDLSTDEATPSQKSIEATMMGTEGVGIVTKIGPKAGEAINGTLELGDLVIPYNFGNYGLWSTRVYANPSDLVVIKNKSGIVAEDLSSIYINMSTAYRMLKDVEKMNLGDYIIQNGANSGVGKYVIQFARILGIKSINIIRDRSDFDEVAESLKDLGADIVIRDTDLESEKTKKLLNSLTSPIRLGLNFVNGIKAVQMARFLSPESTLLTYGVASDEPIPVDANMLLIQRIKFVGFSIFAFYLNNPKEVWAKTWEEIVEFIREKKIKIQESQEVILYENSNVISSVSSQEFR
ncbi:Trans-2-enoyl-CoA reductase, mitochondrial, partial [Smittium mucronatum]